MMKDIYIASCAEDGGILRFSAQGEKLVCKEKTPCDRPMYMVYENGRIYTVLRAPFGSEESGVFFHRVDEKGSLCEPSALLPTGGTVGCHLAVADGDVYVANYVSGSVSHVGKKRDVHEGKGKDPRRQDAPHAHSTVLSPCGKYLLSADLGLDTVFVYDRSLSLVSRASVPSGSGCRHMVFSKDGAYLYVLNELSSDVTVFAWQNGKLSARSTFSALAEENRGKIQSIAAAIRLSQDGRYLYTTNRGENTVCVFGVSGEKLTRLASYPTHGNEPRDFLLIDDENYAIVTNQFSDSVILFRHTVENGIPVLIPVDSVAVKAPLCVLEI